MVACTHHNTPERKFGLYILQVKYRSSEKLGRLTKTELFLEMKIVLLGDC